MVDMSDNGCWGLVNSNEERVNEGPTSPHNKCYWYYLRHTNSKLSLSFPSHFCFLHTIFRSHKILLEDQDHRKNFSNTLGMYFSTGEIAFLPRKISSSPSPWSILLSVREDCCLVEIHIKLLYYFITSPTSSKYFMLQHQSVSHDCKVLKGLACFVAWM